MTHGRFTHSKNSSLTKRTTRHDLPTAESPYCNEGVKEVSSVHMRVIY